MLLEPAITLRYLRSPRAEGAISFISWVALLGVMLGVGALVVAMAIMHGYQSNLIRAMAGALPHVAIHPITASGIHHPERLAGLVEEAMEVEGAASFVLREILVQDTRGQAPVQGIVLRGISSDQEAKVSAFLALINDGSPDWEVLSPADRNERARALLKRFEEEEGEEIPILISPLLGKKLGVGLGDRLNLLRFPKAGKGFNLHRISRQLRVGGFYETGLTVFDELMLITDIRHLPAELSPEDNGSSLGIRLKDPLRAGEAAELLRERGQRDEGLFHVYSWIESNRSLFQVLRLQKVMLFLVLMLIVVIAFFGMISTLTMMVAEKTREIAILKALGASDRSIRLVFLLQGLGIGVLGTVLGLGLGLGISYVLGTVPLLDIPPGVYPGTDRIPVQIAWQDVLLVVGGTMIVCLGACLFPVRKAVNLHPAEGLRYG